MSEVLYDAHPSLWRQNFWLFLLALVLSPVGVGLVILLVMYLKAKATRLVITTDEMRLTTGLVAKEHKEIRLQALRTVQVDQGVLDRMLGVGKVTVFSSGDQPEFSVAGMPDPDRIRQLT